ncbi:MAG: sugar-binding domain-containing protein [Alistipes senegalensis]
MLLFADDDFDQDRTKLFEYNFNTDRTLLVPGDWNTQRPQLYCTRVRSGTAICSTTSPGPTAARSLYFGAANYETIVGLNGRKIGKRVGGYTPFNFEITGKVREGRNSLVVKVDNKRLAEGVPTLNSDW